MELFEKYLPFGSHFDIISIWYYLQNKQIVLIYADYFSLLRHVNA